jgi:hypothetical protein
MVDRIPIMTPPPATSDTSASFAFRGALWGIAIVMIAAHVVLGVMTSSRMSATYDEPAHTVSGEVYWRYNDYRFQPENGNLPQRWCALGNYLFQSKPITRPTDAEWQQSDVWAVVKQKLTRDKGEMGSRLALARSFALFWGAALCGLVFWISRKMFGPEGGLLSLALCAFCPTLLANSPLGPAPK